jgi:membrane fusion protein (multidrug efflux system)
MEAKPKKSGKIIFPIILTVVLIVGGIFGYNKYNYAQHHESTDDAQLEGNINPVSPRASGYVTQLRVDDYRRVKKGDTLVVLDDRDLRIKVAQAQTAVESAKASLAVTNAEVASTQSGFATANSDIEAARVKLDQAQTDFDRINSLYTDKTITKKEYDNAKSALEAAKTDLTGKKTRYTTVQKQYEAKNEGTKVGLATIAQRQADLDFAKLQLAYSVVLAPVSGIVSRKNVQPGQLVQIGQPLFSIVDSNVWVVANFKETQLGDMHEGQEAEVVVDAFSGKTLHAKVADFSAATGAKFSLLPPDNATGNYVKIVQRVPVKLVIDGGDKDVIKSLRPGMSLKVDVKTK